MSRAATTARGLPVAKTLIALNVLAFVYINRQADSRLGPGGFVRVGPEYKFTLNAPAIAPCGQWFRIITSGFVHFDPMHLAFNMLILYVVANVLEREAGSLRFALIYATSLVTGALDALLSNPGSHTGGASGAVFGVAGAATVLMMRRGSTFWNTGFGPLLIINLLYTFVNPNVSLGGHVGGLVGGLICGAILLRDEPTRSEKYVGIAAVLGMLVLAFGACLVVADRAPDLPNCHLYLP